MHSSDSLQSQRSLTADAGGLSRTLTGARPDPAIDGPANHSVYQTIHRADNRRADEPKTPQSGGRLILYQRKKIHLAELFIKE